MSEHAMLIGAIGFLCGVLYVRAVYDDEIAQRHLRAELYLAALWLSDHGQGEFSEFALAKQARDFGRKRWIAPFGSVHNATDQLVHEGLLAVRRDGALGRRYRVADKALVTEATR